MATKLKISTNRLNMNTHSPRSIIRPEVGRFQAAPTVFICGGGT